MPYLCARKITIRRIMSGTPAAGLPAGYNEGRLAYLSETYRDYSTIILANYWGSKFYREDPTFLPALERTLQRLTSEGKQVIVLNTMYKVRTTRRRELNSPRIASIFSALGATSLRGTDYEPYKENAKLANEIADRDPEVRWVDLEPLLPEDGIVSGLSVFENHDHVNHHGAGYLAHKFIEQGSTLVRQGK